jgi:predicted ferric reductase
LSQLYRQSEPRGVPPQGDAYSADPEAEVWDRAMEESRVPSRAVPFLLLATLAGAVLGVVVLPWVAVLEQAVHGSLFGENHPMYAQLSRASALAAYGLIWLSLVLGLLQSTKFARKWPGPAEAFELHRYASLLGLSFTLFHALVLAGDSRLSGQAGMLLMPFGLIAVFPWSWWGQIALYGLIMAAISFYARRFIGKRGWRMVHALAIAFYVMALVHSVGAGQAGGNPALTAFYWVTTGIIALLAVYRGGAVLWERRKGARRAGRRQGAAKANGPAQGRAAG